MEEKNIHLKMIGVIAEKRDEIPAFASEYEAYAVLKEKQETAEKAVEVKKLAECFWGAVKEGNDEAMIAYVLQLETNARNAAAAFAELAAYAARAGKDIGG